MTETFMKTFSTYSDAYELYGDIVSKRDHDRKNASILFVDGHFCVYWESTRE